MAKQYHDSIVNGENVSDLFEDRAGSNNWLGSIFDFLGLGDFYNSITGSGLTSSEIQQNEFNAEQAQLARDFNAEQAQIQRDWQTEMDNTKVQRSVEDMKAAGVNPAMMMGGTGVTASTPSGATASGPAASGSGGHRSNSFDSLMNIAMIGQRFKESNAQIRLVNAQADKTNNEAKYIGLQSAYYPKLTDETLREIDSRIRGNNAGANLDDAKAAHERVQTVLDSIDADWRNTLNFLEARYKGLSGDSEKAAAARDYAAAALDGFELGYMKKHNTHVPSGSSELVALASWITENLGTNESGVVNSVVNAIEQGGFQSLGKGKDEKTRLGWLKDVPDDKLSEEMRKKKHELFGD